MLAVLTEGNNTKSKRFTALIRLEILRNFGHVDQYEGHHNTLQARKLYSFTRVKTIKITQDKLYLQNILYVNKPVGHHLLVSRINWEIKQHNFALQLFKTKSSDEMPQACSQALDE